MTFDLPDALAVLERTPSVLDALLLDLPGAWTTPNEGGESWSAFANVGHLISGELTDWMPRLRIILAQGTNRMFVPFNRLGHVGRDEGRGLGDLLAEFRALRQQNLVDLRALALTPAQLRLTGEHPVFGAVTAEQLLATWVVHDLGHIAQISRVMAKQYSVAVGPWEAYLPVLRR